MRTLLLMALGVVLVSGCSKPAPKSADTQPKGPDQADDRTDGQKLIDKVAEINANQPGNHEVAPPGTNWDPSTTSMVGLGQRMDEAVQNTKNAYCKGLLTYDYPGVGKLTGNPEIKIQDDTHFEIQYMSPEMRDQPVRVRADGSRRAELADKGWQTLTSFKSAPPRLTEKDVLDWPTTFPEKMFSYYIDGSDAWGPLFTAWANGVGGYKALVEEKTFKIGGKSVTQYRVYANSDQLKSTIEVMVDKQYLRPVTVHVNGVDKDGKRYNLFWTGSWQAGGKYDPATFELPREGTKSAKAS